MRFIDLTGQRFGRLVVVSIIKKENNSFAKWLCKCDCGKETITMGKTLRRGNVHSCGCYQKEIAAQRRKEATLPNNQAKLNAIFNSYKQSSRKRGISFNLDFEIFKNLIDKNCFYCGIAPQQTYRPHDGKLFLYTGIDRVDNTIGYTEDNCVPCCMDCNYLKNRVPVWICRKVVKFVDKK